MNIEINSEDSGMLTLYSIIEGEKTVWGVISTDALAFIDGVNLEDLENFEAELIVKV